MTHGDYDHIGNVSSVLRHIKVKDTYIPVGFGEGTLEQEILMELEKRKVQVTMVGTYFGWAAGKYTFQFLHPSKVYEDKNDGSIVLYAELGGLTWLFTGDIEQAGERDLLTLYPNLQADVLKAAHHGSKSSTLDPFVEQIRPTYALISAGRDNRFGHPHTEVVERLREAGAVIYRTDQQGAILYIFTERGGTFSTALP
jgi:competence protein ComEC